MRRRGFEEETGQRVNLAPGYSQANTSSTECELCPEGVQGV